MQWGPHSSAIKNGISFALKRDGMANIIGTLTCFREHTLSR